jgi:hypothetical protein
MGVLRRVMRDTRPPGDLRQSKVRIAACADVRSAASCCRVAGRADMPFRSCSSEFHGGRANRPAIRPVQSQPATHPPRVVVVLRTEPLVQEPLLGGQCRHRCGPRGDEGADQGRSDLSGSRFDRVTRPPLQVSRERTAGGLTGVARVWTGHPARQGFQDRSHSSRSRLMTSCCVVIMPCG